MRHFSNVLNQGVFKTITSNGAVGELELIGLDPAKSGNTDKLVIALCACLEIRRKDFLAYIKAGKSSVLTTAECRIVDEFREFYNSVINALDGVKTDIGNGVTVSVVDTFEKVFHYTNLNEGKSVVWFVSLFG